ncbi:MYXO-CTERM sorting domain-containing protein, partial [Pyxidicoccus sp. 3LFB2]
PQGCGASATGTGGAPFIAAALLALGAMLGRRRQQARVHAVARSRRR